MTPKQLSVRTGLRAKTARAAVRELHLYGIVVCLTPERQQGRVYGLTLRGIRCKQRVCTRAHNASQLPFDPMFDWNVYGWLCFSQRRACLLTLNGPMQPATIARHAARAHRDRPFDATRIRMSANNARDIVKLFLKQGLVTTVQVRRRAHTHFTLTELGKQCQLLLHRAGGNHELCM